MVPAPGCRQWWQIERLDRRDRILRQIANEHFPGVSRRRQAVEISKRAAHYEAGRWRQDRVWRSAPAISGDSLKNVLFHLLKCGEAPSPRTIERVLAARHELPAFGDALDLGSRAVEVTDALDEEAQLDFLA